MLFRSHTAKHIVKNSAENLSQISLELGGKSPVVVFKDARKNNAINGIMASIFGAGGQSCIAGSRLYLQEEIYDEYLEELKNRVEESDWNQAISKTIEIYGKIDILVNNAGVGLIDMNQMSVDAWDKYMDINAKGAFLGMKYVIPEMIKNGGGSIVNIVSMSSLVINPVIHVGYNASKGASRIASKAVAVKYAQDNIHIMIMTFLI